MRLAALLSALLAASHIKAAFHNSWTPNTEVNVPSLQHSAFGEVDLPLEGGVPSQSFDNFPLTDHGWDHSYVNHQQPYHGAFDLPPGSFDVHDYSMYGLGQSSGNHVHGDLAEYYYQMPPPPAETYDGHAMNRALAEEGSSTLLDPTQSWHQGDYSMYTYPGQEHGYPMAYGMPPQPTTLHERMQGQVDAFDRLDLSGVVSLPRIQTGVEQEQGIESSSGAVPRRRKKERAQPQTARVSRTARSSEERDNLEAPATSRTTQKFERRARMRLWLVEEWKKRAITWSLPAQELAARVAEIKIDYPDQIASIGHYSGDFVQHDSGRDFKYKYAYHRWSLTYYNKINNLKRSFDAKQLHHTPETLRQALHQHLREVVPRHHATRADPEEEKKHVAYSHVVWDKFMEERMQPALDGGEVFSMPLLARLAHGFTLINLNHEDTIRFLKTYLLNVMELPPQDLEEFRSLLQIERRGTSTVVRKPPRGRRL